MVIKRRMSPRLELLALAIEAEKRGVHVEVIGDEKGVVKVGEGKIPEAVMPPQRVELPVVQSYIEPSPSGQARRRARRAMERKNKKR